MNLPFPNLNDYIALFSLTEAKLPCSPLLGKNSAASRYAAGDEPLAY